MARGKIQIKRIDNATNRQVTYSKRRNGLFKKAHELSILCDARVSLIMVSNTGKIHEYASHSTTTKQLLDLYQRTLKIDLWSSQYEKMQENLKKLKEKNYGSSDTDQRMGQCLEDLSFEELHNLEEEMENSATTIRERKYKVMSNQIGTTNKKLNQAKQVYNVLQSDGIIKDDIEIPDYGFVDDEDYDSVSGFANEIPNLLALGLHLNYNNYNNSNNNNNNYNNNNISNNEPNICNKAESVRTSCYTTNWGLPKF